jgi:hypothetical protein
MRAGAHLVGALNLHCERGRCPQSVGDPPEYDRRGTGRDVAHHSVVNGLTCEDRNVDQQEYAATRRAANPPI